mgnify:CR=1 FL=1
MWKKKTETNRTGITSRITIVIILVAVISAGSSGLIAYYISKNQFAAYVDRFGFNMGSRYAGLVLDYYDQYGTLEGLQNVVFSGRHPMNGQGRMGQGMNRSGPGMMLSTMRRVIITDNTGRILADSELNGSGSSNSFSKEDYTKYPVVYKDKRTIAIIYVFSPLKGGISSLENNYLADIRAKMADSIAVFALLALLVGLLLARRMTQPINALSSAIHEVARGNLGVRVEYHGDREFTQLAGEFNQMVMQLNEHEQNRNALMVNIAHELRTPLSIIRGNLEGLQAGSLVLNDEMKSALVDEIIRLTRLVKDLETVGLAEVGALKINLELIRVEEILDSIMPLRLAMEEKGICFVNEVDNNFQVIRADRQRLTQILINLLTNAMRHTPPREAVIKLNISIRPDAVVFMIQDNGAGISPEHLPYIFERFYRVDEDRSRDAGGTGLGLAIARSYVEAHGGRIWVESRPGEGASFYFTLPQKGL